MSRRALLVLPLTLFWACTSTSTPERSAASVPAIAAESVSVIDDLRWLSSAELEGRAAGSHGNLRAREYIVERFQEIGLAPIDGEWVQPFPLSGGAEQNEAANVIGMIQGDDPQAGIIVVSAHYDHLGRRGDVVYPGADDNASGVAAMIEAARHFAANPPRHSILFLATDAEEGGLRGARHFVANPPVDFSRVVLNVNLDMVSRSDRNELYVAGRTSGDTLTDIVAEVQRDAEVTLIPGHDRETPEMEDWTDASDHGPFNAAGIPWLYFGVEDHPDYHQPTDVFESIDPAFYLRSVRTILSALEIADQRL